MFEFIKIQYILGRITREQVESFVDKYITQNQANEIIGENK